ncbi:MAG: hypothetical protein J6Z11_15285 [Candidatus Riflebacteria bacterium]|nr:hypothetical protein [Candidatus Riflebacteria bacterium]
MESSTIKGIRYSYQIDYYNAEPTHLKSQVHNLPVVSEPQATPLDQYIRQDNYVPNNDSRITYAAPSAAVSAAPSLASVGNSTTISALHSGIPTGGIGSADSLNVSAPNDTNPLLSETHIAEPQQIIKSSQAESAFSHPASAVSAEAGLNGNLGNVLHPTQQFVGLDKISSDIPTSDANPIEGVKANPKADFQSAERSYIPNQNSFFQKNGLESVVTDGNTLEVNNTANNVATADIETIKDIEAAQATETETNRPSYLVPGPDETPETDTATQFFNRFLGQQAKTLYGYISGAVSQFSQSTFNAIG